MHAFAQPLNLDAVFPLNVILHAKEYNKPLELNASQQLLIIDPWYEIAKYGLR